MIETFLVPTVAKGLFRGVLTVLLLGACAFSMFLVVFLVFANNSGEVGERTEWCTEYMPTANRIECAVEAGWSVTPPPHSAHSIYWYFSHSMLRNLILQHFLD